MFAYDKSWWSRAEQFDHAVEFRVLVRGVDVTEIRLGRLGPSAAEPARDVGADQRAPVAAAKALRGLGDERERLAVALDKGDRCRSRESASKPTVPAPA